MDKRIKYSMDLINKMKDDPDIDIIADTQLSNLITSLTTEKLDKAREKGYHGWWNEEVCDTDYLKEKILASFGDEDYVSAMNFTAMLLVRSEYDKEKTTTI